HLVAFRVFPAAIGGLFLVPTVLPAVMHACCIAAGPDCFNDDIGAETLRSPASINKRPELEQAVAMTERAPVP
ncbi:hypothetical protein, partial [Nocardia brasiliensis]|uniref:hypothetical protein n=1 Tax=Nocardia brasiliensis TaxID=37326 RepID=UPI002455088D